MGKRLRLRLHRRGKYQRTRHAVSRFTAAL